MRTLLPALAWTLVIAVLISVPGSYVPGKVWSFDKVGHFGMFAGFGTLWYRDLAQRTRRPTAWTGLAGVTYAVGTEVVQSLMPGLRTGDPWDVLANVAGLAAGIAAAVWSSRRARRGIRTP